MTSDYIYCNSFYSFKRFKTKVISIGDVPMGGNNPIRVQSMTNTNTLDTTATVEQCIRMIEAGCEYVRITTPTIKEAENLAHIKKELRRRGFDTPLIADIHFNPEVAEVAARIVEKIRINPGNYVDRKKIGKTHYSDAEYNSELQKINKRIAPLLKICKEYGTAIRIGTNHGSLSDRILNRYGNTPLGMVESAIEFVRICEEQGFNKLVLSMKSSNIRVMVDAYHLLVQRMVKEWMNYPLHIGVTEAGSGEEGRIKSAAGIGALLEDGIGDTIRVSLTEPPEAEIPVAKILVNRYGNKIHASDETDIDPLFKKYFPEHYMTNEVGNIGNNNVPVVIVTAYEKINCKEADYIYCYEKSFSERPAIIHSRDWNKKDKNSYPSFSVDDFFKLRRRSPTLNFIMVGYENINAGLVARINNDPTVVLVLEGYEIHASVQLRRLICRLADFRCTCPVIVSINYRKASLEEFQIYAASDMGLIMTSGLGAGIWLQADKIKASDIERTSFEILQAVGSRIVKTEYISCPTCGRTSFNLIETIERIKQYTGHLKGLKIAIMGCVVNGPGEMADADYGYVGSSKGKINLYKGKKLVQRNIKEADALDVLIKMIKDNGDWIEER